MFPFIKMFEVTLYSVNPHPNKEKLLENEERLNEDINSLNNVIIRIFHLSQNKNSRREIIQLEYPKYLQGHIILVCF